MRCSLVLPLLSSLLSDTSLRSPSTIHHHRSRLFKQLMRLCRGQPASLRLIHGDLAGPPRQSCRRIILAEDGIGLIYFLGFVLSFCDNTTTFVGIGWREKSRVGRQKRGRSRAHDLSFSWFHVVEGWGRALRVEVSERKLFGSFAPWALFRFWVHIQDRSWAFISGVVGINGLGLFWSPKLKN